MNIILGTDDIQISFQIFNFILRDFVLTFWEFNRTSSRKENLKKMMESLRNSDQFQ